MKKKKHLESGWMIMADYGFVGDWKSRDYFNEEKEAEQYLRVCYPDFIIKRDNMKIVKVRIEEV